MNENENILPLSISGIAHIAAFDSLMNQRLGSVELDALLVYVIDTVSSNALPALAKQFDVEGSGGFLLATTEAQRREIIKQAIDLKRYIGTVYAVKQAIKIVGYTDVQLIEGIDRGNSLIDWARFSINSTLGTTTGIDTLNDAKLTALIKEYKNVRSILEGISYDLEMSDTITDPDDTLQLEFEIPDLNEDLGYFARFADGNHLADGSIKAIESLDELQIEIINL